MISVAKVMEKMVGLSNALTQSLKILQDSKLGRLIFLRHVKIFSASYTIPIGFQHLCNMVHEPCAYGYLYYDVFKWLLDSFLTGSFFIPQEKRLLKGIYFRV